jgi:hypothetical protein
LEEAAQQSFILRERNHTTTDIAGRKHVIFAAKSSGAAPVIGDSHDGDKIGDGPLPSGVRIAATDKMLLQTSEQHRETAAAAKSDNAKACDGALFQARFFHEQLNYESPS